MTKIPTLKEIEAMTAAELVAFYNAFEKPEKPVSKFSSRKVGVERVTKAIQEAKKAQPQATSSKVTVASRCRELILAGKDNEEIFKIVKKQFDMPDTKKSWPGWYRNEMRRKGLI